MLFIIYCLWFIVLNSNGLSNGCASIINCARCTPHIYNVMSAPFLSWHRKRANPWLTLAICTT
nr:MAG TPA: hypothetical protein [Caudoviricetes sp.]